MIPEFDVRAFCDFVEDATAEGEHIDFNLMREVEGADLFR